MKKIILSGMLLLFSCGLLAQHIQVLDDGTRANFMQSSVVEISPGRYIIAGTVTPGPVSGASDILVLRTDATNVLWAKYVDYGQDEFVGSVMVDAAGHIVLTGYTGINNTPSKNLVIVKLDGGGNYVDDVVIEDPILNYGLYGFDIEQTNAGDYIVVGTGVQAATISAQKYAFALQVAPNLNSINWGRSYHSSSPGAPTNYDAFSHILKSPIFPFLHLSVIF